MCTNTISICCLSKKIKQMRSFSFRKLEFTISRERTLKLLNALLFNKPPKTPLITAHSGYSIYSLVQKEKVSYQLTDPIQVIQEVFHWFTLWKGKTWELSLFLGQQIQQNQPSQHALSNNRAIAPGLEKSKWEEIWINVQIYPVNFYNKSVIKSVLWLKRISLFSPYKINAVNWHWVGVKTETHL